jgi:hypothetical protein
MLPQPAGEDAFAGVAGRSAHGVGFGLLHAQGEAGQAVGDQVDPQDLGRGQGQREAEQGATSMTQISAEPPVTP